MCTKPQKLNTLFWENWYKSNKDIDGKYTELESSHLISTLGKLSRRISERFPGSGLYNVSAEAIKVAHEVESLLQRIGRPIWFLRGLIWCTILLIVVTLVTIIVFVFQQSSGIDGWADYIQATEAGVNDLIFLAISLWFIASLESRAKRKALLTSLHRLRSMAHVVDIHQLTKDPAQLMARGLASKIADTASSPQRTMSAYELSRYLDYCSEMLSLLSKLAALHAQKENDNLVLDAVNDVEALANGLSSKIWQKLSMLDKVLIDEVRNRSEN